MNIVLIGYRGSGKTTIGKRLADELWKQFVDLDDAVCKAMGDRSIAQIWSEDGPAAFRKTEHEQLRRLLQGEEQVIALGGGAVIPFDDPATGTAADGGALLQGADHKVSVYLQCKPDVLANRIATDATRTDTRPSQVDGNDGLTRIEAELAERDPIYQRVADHTFDVTHTNADEAVRHIIARCL